VQTIARRSERSPSRCMDWRNCGPDRIADPEEEQEEQEGLRHARDRHLGELADGEACNQRPGHRTKGNARDLDVAEDVADPDRQEDGELRIGLKEVAKPFMVVSRFAGQTTLNRRVTVTSEWERRRGSGPPPAGRFR
jgi:hypothetical protein